ncbi:hypothetical protein [Nocardia asiatica]|uniref:hypothetical protein n=1 Tax=Nocardia asiatica TaxID=209252 RepID=UPI00245399D1|nr:hypothetical protein [Nocardia asiatica]
MTMAAGSTGRSGGVRLGRFGTDRWEHGTELVPELFVGCEGFAAGADEALGTVRYYAAHRIARTLAVMYTSRAGAYHNGRYKQIAEEIVLTVEHTPGRGGATTTLAKATSDARTAANFQPWLRHWTRTISKRRGRPPAPTPPTRRTTPARTPASGEHHMVGARWSAAVTRGGGCAHSNVPSTPVRFVRVYRDPFHVDLPAAGEAGRG